jgi:hypothetical protein
MSGPADNSQPSAGAVADHPAKIEGALRGFSRWFNWRLGTVLVIAAVSIPIWRVVTTHAKAHTSQPRFLPRNQSRLHESAGKDLFKRNYNTGRVPALLKSRIAREGFGLR